MNGKCAKRIRKAAEAQKIALGIDQPLRAIYQKLKREYKATPYHQRIYGPIPKQGHSERLVQRHSVG